MSHMALQRLPAKAWQADKCSWELCPGWPQTCKMCSKTPKSHPAQACLWRQPINLFLPLKLEAQIPQLCGDSFSVGTVKLLNCFFSLTASSFACENCQKQSRKKEQFLIKPHVSADLLVPHPNFAFNMFYLHYLLCLWAASAVHGVAGRDGY